MMCNDEIDGSEDMAVIFGGAGAWMTNIMFIWRCRRWSHFFKRVSDFRMYGEPATYGKVANRLNFYSTIYFWYCFLGMNVYALTAIYESKECRKLNAERSLHEICWGLTPIWLPLSYQESLSSYMKATIFLLQCCAAFNITTCAALVSFLTWEATEILITHMAHLKHHMLHTFHDSDNTFARLRFCAGYHNFVFSVAVQLNGLAKGTVGHVSLVAALVFGCIGNQIFKSKPLGAFIFLAGWVVAMFVICHAGQRINDESLSVADAIYFSKWYQGITKHKKDMAFVMFRSQKPVHFDALPFGTLNYPLFVMIVKTSYSYLTLLNR